MTNTLKETQKRLIQEYADKKWHGDQHMIDYIVKTTTDAFVTADGKICGFDKPRIKTEFCFSDEGPAYELYKDLHSADEKMRCYFMHENLRQYDDLLERLENQGEGTEYVGFWDNNDGTACLTFRRYWQITDCGEVEKGLEMHELEPNFYVAKGADRLKAIEVLKDIRAAFVKRLETWWKKYGAEKLHTWTYWADA